MSEIKYFEYHKTLPLESGEILSRFRLAYQTFGKLNADRSNVVWIIHALTANSNPLEWWPGVVGTGEAINPEKHFIICANTLGSHYGSTYAMDLNPASKEAYYHEFPLLTNRDIVNAFDKLRLHLGISKINLLIGSSLGGQQALEWSIIQNDAIENLILIATNAKHSPYGIAFNESQRLAIEADGSWPERRPDAGSKGLLAARSIAMLSYRTNEGYDLSQQDLSENIDGFRASSYQRYQGQKLVNRFNAFSYWTLSKAMDSHNVGRGRESIEHALKEIKAKVIVLGIETDFLFPLKEQKYLAENIPNATLVVINSILGHDGFLTESAQVSEVIRKFDQIKTSAKPMKLLV